MADRFNSLDNTSPTTTLQNANNLDIDYSHFDYSCLVLMNGLIGALMPFDSFEVVPNERLKIGYDVLAMVRSPLVRRLMSGMRIYIHTYFMRCSQIWEGFPNFITKGRSGRINLEVPKLKVYKDNGSSALARNTPLSLLDFLGVPSSFYDSQNPINNYKVMTGTKVALESKRVGNFKGFVSAFKPAMYQMIYRDRYLNKNLTQENKNWFPDNNEHFILSYGATEVDKIDYENENINDFTSYLNEINTESFYVPDNEDSSVDLSALRFRQFKGDYFTSALPFPELIRGDIPSMDVATLTSSINWDDVFGTPTGTIRDMKTGTNGVIGATASPMGYTGGSTDLKEAFNKAKINSILQASISLADIRQLETLTLMKQRFALTNGDYNQLIDSQYNYNPNMDDNSPTYIGGTYQDISFNEVLQTSSDSDDSLFGSARGRAVSAGSGFIGEFHVPDFGYIMSIMSIVPDTIYTQGLDKEFTRFNQSEWYFPILNNLSPQAILNKEIYISGDDSIDNDVYGYNERYSEYKTRRNKAKGLVALSHDKADFDASLIMARRFSDTPTLSNDFVTMSPKNIDMSIFTVVDEPPFDLQIACRVERIAPMPYVTLPGGLSPRS